MLPLEFDPQNRPPQAELGLGPHPGALSGPAAVAATFEPFDQVGVAGEGDSIFCHGLPTFQSSQVYLGLLGFTVADPSDNGETKPLRVIGLAVDDATRLCLVGVYPNQTSGDHPEIVRLESSGQFIDR